MDQPITRAEHEEFKRRLEEENARQDRRIALLEESVSKMGALSTSVEKLALSMESMVREQEKQGKRLETLESRDGELWRKAVGYAVTAIIGAFLGYPNPLCDLSAAFRRSQGFQNRSRAERRQEYGHLHRLPDPARSRLCCHAPLMPVLHSNHGR